MRSCVDVIGQTIEQRGLAEPVRRKIKQWRGSADDLQNVHAFRRDRSEFDSWSRVSLSFLNLRIVNAGPSSASGGGT